MDTPELVEKTLDILNATLDVAGNEMDRLRAENETLKAMLKEAYPLLRRHTDSECLGPKSLLTRIFDTVIKEK
ncbi:hypothetical protein LCGC14_1200110 [marine sediment metagenome]|uniref:Uncharacterized protein n=2 Tax=marine sediment metagenome TaxID=412755 RepID=A0A0F9NZN4_9ZZZZ